jgi:hypothetical protein
MDRMLPVCKEQSSQITPRNAIWIVLDAERLHSKHNLKNGGPVFTDDAFSTADYSSPGTP